MAPAVTIIVSPESILRIGIDNIVVSELGHCNSPSMDGIVIITRTVKGRWKGSDSGAGSVSFLSPAIESEKQPWA